MILHRSRTFTASQSLYEHTSYTQTPTMPRPAVPAGRTRRAAAATTTCGGERSGRTLEPSSATAAPPRRRKGTPSKAPSRTEPSSVPVSTPGLVKVLLRARQLDLDNLRSAAPTRHDDDGDAGGSPSKKRKRTVARDALPPAIEGYGRGKRASSSGAAAAAAIAPDTEHRAVGADRRRSPAPQNALLGHGTKRARSPVATHAAAGSRRAMSTSPRMTAAGAGAGAYSQHGHAHPLQHSPLHASPLSPPNHHRMHRSRSTGPAAATCGMATPTDPGLPSAVHTSGPALAGPAAPAHSHFGNAYAMGIAAVNAPSPLARSFSANGTVADAMAAAATAAANTTSPSADPVRARTPSNTTHNGGAYRVAELSGAPIQCVSALRDLWTRHRS